VVEQVRKSAAAEDLGTVFAALNELLDENEGGCETPAGGTKHRAL
jgi:hypothetical protein